MGASQYKIVIPSKARDLLFSCSSHVVEGARESRSLALLGMTKLLEQAEDQGRCYGVEAQPLRMTGLSMSGWWNSSVLSVDSVVDNRRGARRL